MKKIKSIPAQSSTKIYGHSYQKKIISQQVVEFTVAQLSVLEIRIGDGMNMQGKQIQSTFPRHSVFNVSV